VLTAKPGLHFDAEAWLWFDLSAQHPAGEGEGGRGAGRPSPSPGKLPSPPQSLFHLEEVINEITARPQLGMVSKTVLNSS